MATDTQTGNTDGGDFIATVTEILDDVSDSPPFCKELFLIAQIREASSKFLRTVGLSINSDGDFILRVAIEATKNIEDALRAYTHLTKYERYAAAYLALEKALGMAKDRKDLDYIADYILTLKPRGPYLRKHLISISKRYDELL